MSWIKDKWVLSSIKEIWRVEASQDSWPSCVGSASLSSERVAAMTTYVTHANKWKTDQGEGWELYVDGVGATQVDHLEEAEAQVRDLIETMTDSSAADVQVEILVEDQVR